MLQVRPWALSPGSIQFFQQEQRLGFHTGGEVLPFLYLLPCEEDKVRGWPGQQRVEAYHNPAVGQGEAAEIAQVAALKPYARLLEYLP